MEKNNKEKKQLNIIAIAVIIAIIIAFIVFGLFFIGGRDRGNHATKTGKIYVIGDEIVYTGYAFGENQIKM